MRACTLLLALCAACATPIYDLPEGRRPDGGKAMLAGAVAFENLHLHRLDGDEFTIRPEHEDFLVEIPPGTYVVAGLGRYRPAHDRVVIEALAGKALYVGSFLPGEDEGDGDFVIVLRDEMPAVESALVERYGVSVPQLERKLARSSLDGAPAEFTLRVKLPRPRVYYGVGFHWGLWAHHLHYSHHRSHRRRR